MEINHEAMRSSLDVRARPNEPCLIGGSLPLFDSGRAEHLP
jgi:hypothetical protein